MSPAQFTAAMPRLSQRPAHPEDIPFLCGFAANETDLCHFFPSANHPLTPEQLKSNMDARFGSTVILADGAVAGYGNLYHHTLSGVPYMGNLIVDPNRRGQGLGRYLVETMLEISFEHYDFEAVYLCCFNTNIVGLRLYGRFGFKPYELEFLGGKMLDGRALIHFCLERSLYRQQGFCALPKGPGPHP